MLVVILEGTNHTNGMLPRCNYKIANTTLSNVFHYMQTRIHTTKDVFNAVFSFHHCWYALLCMPMKFTTNYFLLFLKGKFAHTMWIGWVESNFTNPTVKVWADLDNPFKRSDYAKLCMSPSLGGTLPEYVISHSALAYPSIKEEGRYIFMKS